MLSIGRNFSDADMWTISYVIYISATLKLESSKLDDPFWLFT